jgi:hypothetical protein
VTVGVGSGVVLLGVGVVLAGDEVEVSVGTALVVDSSVDVGVDSSVVLSGATDVGVSDVSGAGAGVDTWAGVPVPEVVEAGGAGRISR